MTPQERIKADAEAATNDHAVTLRAKEMEYAAMIMRLFGYKEGYIAGATAEHEHNKSERLQLEAQNANVEILLSQKKDITARARVLVDALDQFISYHETGLLPARHIYEKAVAAREQWKSGKEVGDE